MQDIIDKAKELGSYFVTITLLDRSKETGNLEHFAFREEFPTDDIVSSVDQALRSMRIKPPQVIPVIRPQPNRNPTKPLKIAIITHFNTCPEYYSPGRAVKNQIKLLKQYGHTPVFFVREGSKMELDCEIRAVMPAFKREKNIVNEAAKERIIDVLREHLTSDFDLAITHDFYIDDCITYREAIRACGVPIKWLHWARSGVGKPIDFNMDNARYVYMNYADAGTFAKMINVNPDKVRVIFNEKDPTLLWNWHPATKMIAERLKLWEKDIIQTYPLCSTRMDSKGLDSAIEVFAALKELGQKVCLIICNSNSSKRVGAIKAKLDYAGRLGLNSDEVVFTSTLSGGDFDFSREVPHKVIVELMQISNLFVFPTRAEVSSNVLLEAQMTKNLIVLNEDLPCLLDNVDKGVVLKYPFTSNQSVHYGHRYPEALLSLAKNIIGQIQSNKADKSFRYVWRNNNLDTLYWSMYDPILMEGLVDSL